MGTFHTKCECYLWPKMISGLLGWCESGKDRVCLSKLKRKGHKEDGRVILKIEKGMEGSFIEAIFLYLHYWELREWFLDYVLKSVIVRNSDFNNW